MNNGDFRITNPKSGIFLVQTWFNGGFEQYNEVFGSLEDAETFMRYIVENRGHENKMRLYNGKGELLE